MKSLPPIHYTSQQVSRMVAIAVQLDSHLAERTLTPAADIELIAAGQRKPSAGVLAAFELQPTARGYSWQPR